MACNLMFRFSHIVLLVVLTGCASQLSKLSREPAAMSSVEMERFQRNQQKKSKEFLRNEEKIELRNKQNAFVMSRGYTTCPGYAPSARTISDDKQYFQISQIYHLQEILSKVDGEKDPERLLKFLETRFPENGPMQSTTISLILDYILSSDTYVPTIPESLNSYRDQFNERLVRCSNLDSTARNLLVEQIMQTGRKSVARAKEILRLVSPTLCEDLTKIYGDVLEDLTAAQAETQDRAMTALDMSPNSPEFTKIAPELIKQLDNFTESEYTESLIYEREKKYAALSRLNITSRFTTIANYISRICTQQQADRLYQIQDQIVKTRSVGNEILLNRFMKAMQPSVPEAVDQTAKIKSLNLEKDCEVMQIRMQNDYAAADRYYYEARKTSFSKGNSVYWRVQNVSEFINYANKNYVGTELEMRCRAPRALRDYLNEMTAIRNDIRMYDQ